jgi:UDP-glucose 4-epimerase
MTQYQEGLKGKKILITGGAGFIGSHLTDRLSLENEVIVLDNLFSGALSNLKESNDRITFIKGDILNKTLCKDIVAQVDFVFHLAADVGNVKSIEDPFSNMDVNVRGTLNLLEACLTSSITRFVYSSSAANYGETRYLPIDEDCPLNPESPYAVSKLAAEKYAFAYYKVHGIPTTSLRYFNVYGPRQESSEYGNVIPIFLKRIREGKPITIFGDGSQTRDFVFVEDVVQANILAATESRAIGEIFNVATGKRTSINELVNLIRQVTEKEVTAVHADPRAGEVVHSLASIKKAEKMLEYDPKTDLKQGLLLTWKDEQMVKESTN